MSQDTNQRELGSEQNIADELAENQQQASIAEFFGKNKQMLGFDTESRALVTAIKETVDNSLDACEEAGILPDISVEVEETDDYYRVTVEDNGPGIKKEQIPKVFGQLLYGSRFHTRSQTRGQQGIGVSASVLYSQRTSGKATKVVSRAKGEEEANYYELTIDEENNEADIRDEEVVEWEKEHGTKITLEMAANMRARNQLHNYIRYSAVVNPHARIEFTEPQEEMVYERSVDELPPETEEIDPHPHGVELGTLITMLKNADEETVSEFLQDDFVRVGAKGAQNILDNFVDRFHGREMAWNVSSDAIELSVVDTTQLSDSTVAAVAAQLSERLANTDKRVTPTEYAEIVDEAIDAAEEETGIRIGDPYTLDEPSAWAEVAETNTSQESATLSQWGNNDGRGTIGQAVANATAKGDAALDALAASLTDQLADTPRVTFTELRELVREAAETAESDADVTFGRTAQENVTEAVWDELHDADRETQPVREAIINQSWRVAAEEVERGELLSEWFDEETTKRKEDDAVAALADETAALLSQREWPERTTYRSLEAIVNDAADTVEHYSEERFGETSRENLTDRLWNEMECIGENGSVPPVDVFAEDRQACQNLLEGMRSADIMSPPTNCLAPITEEELETGLRTVFGGADMYETVTRSAEVNAGDPFIVEAGLAYGGDIFEDEDRHADDKARVLRFANRVPLVYQRGACSTVDVIKRIDWRNYFTGSNSLKQTGGSGIPNGELVILVHVASTSVPFTSESKDAVANVDVIEDEVELALRQAARQLKSHLSKQKSLQKRRTKKRVVGKVLPKIADKAAEVAEEEQADTTRSMARVMNSVLLRPFENGENKVSLENYSNNTESFRVTLHFDGKPTYPSRNTTREETEDGWVVVWDDSLDSGDTVEMTWNDAAEPEITYSDIPQEKVSTTDRTPLKEN